MEEPSLVSLSCDIPGCSFLDRFCSIKQMLPFWAQPWAELTPLGPATSAGTRVLCLMPHHHLL